eukprot:UN01415
MQEMGSPPTGLMVTLPNQQQITCKILNHTPNIKQFTSTRTTIHINNSNKHINHKKYNQSNKYL